ncbi:helix-turn-helix domain-containing protein [Flaviaesturariibacter aridisoli]|uniref:AraC family transcriptional regulator n=1 Tax=Flaviaesturariibacter aridisoli TaxID=2545761 RepID=A0A4R4E1C4_9BACT|nr:AraC family transcriptional regulator [Flaviaesturariibacter aridisoli]TCZ72252.1 AraC family transcriptional regulator [Flaviaesturariibacter aridisoli]
MTPHAHHYARIVKAKLFIDAHYAEALNLSLIADEAHFSRFHFIRLFKSIYRLTPHQYLVHVRMKEARKLLQQGCAVTDAMLAVGFDSITSFSSLFRRHHRQTPGQYRRLQLQRRRLLREEPLRFVPHCFAAQKGWV